MRRFASFLLIVLTSVSLLACSPTISGTPSQVLEQCQSVPTNQTPTVTVTGYVDSLGVFESGDRWVTWIGDTRAESELGCVLCSFDDNSGIRAGQRVTVTGEAWQIYSSHISLHHCQVL